MVKHCKIHVKFEFEDHPQVTMVLPHSWFMINNI